VTLAEAFWPLAGWVICQPRSASRRPTCASGAGSGRGGSPWAGAICGEAGLLVLGGSTDAATVLAGYALLGGTGAGLVYASCTSFGGQVVPGAQRRPGRRGDRRVRLRLGAGGGRRGPALRPDALGQAVLVAAWCCSSRSPRPG
jgi:hypothetical protein